MVVLDAVRAALRAEIERLNGVTKNLLIEELMMAVFTSAPGMALRVVDFEMELSRLPEDRREERLKQMVSSLTGSVGPATPPLPKTGPSGSEVA